MADKKTLREIHEDAAKTAGKPHSTLEGKVASTKRFFDRYKKKPKSKKEPKKRVSKQFGGGLPTQPVVGANLPVGANPMGVAAGVGAPGRRFGMKHGSKKSREKKSTGGRVGYSDGGQVRPDGGWTE